MKKSTQLFFTILFLFINFQANFQANAAEIISSDAKYKNDRFIISVNSKLDTSTESVFKILTDYENITKLSKKIIESKIIKSEKNETTVKTVFRGCALFFCKTMTNLQITKIINKNNIESTTIPEFSDFKFGKMNWNIKETEDGTIVKYYAEIEPDFFVPPLIGAYFIKKSMKKEAELLAVEIEKRAKEPELQKDPL